MTTKSNTKSTANTTANTTKETTMTTTLPTNELKSIATAAANDATEVQRNFVAWLAEAGVEADVLLECSGNARATWDAVSTMARAGRVILVGMGGDTVQLPLSYVQDRELTITGAFRYAPAFERLDD